MTLTTRRSMMRAVAIATVFGLGASNTVAQVPMFSADVDLVRLSVAVVSETGVAIDDLKADEFVVVEDGLTQDVTVFLSPRDAPLDIAIVMDGSGSVEADIGDIRASAEAFLDLLGPKDCVYFRVLPKGPARAAWVRPADQAFRAKLAAVRGEGSTDLYDAVSEAVRELVGRRDGYVWQRPDGDAPGALDYSPEAAACHDGGSGGDVARVRRQAAVLLSDGNDTASEETFPGVLTMLWEAQVPVFAIAAGGTRSLGAQFEFLIRSTPPNRRQTLPHYARLAMEAQERHRTRLREMARVSGGELIIAPGTRRAEEERLQAYSTVVNRLRASYMLGYTPASTPAEDAEVPRWRAIEVTTTRHGARVVTRGGHYPVPSAGLRARALVSEARQAASRGELVQALEILERAARADPGLWEVECVRGAVHGMVGYWTEAMTHLGRCLELNPGLASASEALADASLNAGDLTGAWEHAIRATLAGSPTGREQLGRLREVAAAPEDLEARLQVPRVFVGEPDLLDLASNLVVNRFLVTVRHALSEARGLGLVRDASLADLLITIEVNELASERPRTLNGVLRASVRGEENSAFTTRIGTELFEKAKYQAAAADAIRQLEAWVGKNPGKWRAR